MKLVAATRSPAPAASDGELATKAVIRAAERLDISSKVLSRIIGLSEATVSRMGKGAYALGSGDKAFELALLLVRVFRSLDGVTDGDEAVARAWLRNDNSALGGTPLTLLQSIPGLVYVLGYLDARRALA